MFDALVTALEATGYPFAHFGWSHGPDGTYGCWNEERAEDLVANGRHIERGTVVKVDLFTRDDSATPRTTVETALNSLPFPWRLDDINYERETGLIHYLWVVGVYG